MALTISAPLSLSAGKRTSPSCRNSHAARMELVVSVPGLAMEASGHGEWSGMGMGANQGFLRLFPLELLQLVGFRGKWPELSNPHRVKGYMEDGERFQTRLFGPLDIAMPEAAAPFGVLSYEPINSLSAKAWLRWISVIYRRRCHPPAASGTDIQKKISRQ